MNRPVIGISCYVEPARFTVWDTTTALLPYSYVERVAEAGGQPVMIPPIAEPVGLLDRLDGLILAGGGDIDPARYADSRHETVGHVHDFRDDAEFMLASAALDRDLPMLGVCRGLQVLNVAGGGSLHQHLPDVVGHTDHSPRPGHYGRGPVRATDGSSLAGLIGTQPVDVAHYHHQAVDRIGAGLVVSAHAPDGTVEGLEHPHRRFVVAVQWHPEVDVDRGLFAGLVAAASG